ncbi:helix-turn-helix domain-containing protein, partial [Amylibacter sp. SFDW26]|uniref:helix-turn-helix domain-containing protein n=1 Tax=Amylibacter sp. SFDW26 TaxID=2652722 RepID=UPI0013253C5A
MPDRALLVREAASEKLEIIRTVEASHLPTKKTLRYDLYLEGGLDGVTDQSPCPMSVWNRIPETRRVDMIQFALEHEALTPRKLALKYTEEKRHFISETSVYRISKAADSLTVSSHVTIKVAPEFHGKTAHL